MSEEKPTNGELAIMLSNLTKTVTEGFEGVHKRQDYTNGKVLKNDEFRLKNEQLLEDLREEHKDDSKRLKDVIWKIGMVVAGLVLGIKEFWR